MATAADLTHYDAALAYLYSRINYERQGIPAYRVQNFKLERMREVMRRLGDPHLGLPIIHVAGTKGKGSTSSMVAAMLTAAGYCTGLYTSPHLERTEERLAIDGAYCTPEEFAAVLRSMQPVIDGFDDEASRCEGPGSPTYFEVMTAMALVHFARQKVDAVVLEVGLGGRLDSTNIVAPQVTVITSISFDHTRQLGHTLAAIAGEKAGIIKPGIPVVTGVTEAEPLEVIERVARETRAPLVRVGEHFRYAYAAAEPGADKLPRGRMCYEGNIDGHATRYEELELGLLGEHQAANAAVALATVERLQERGWKLSEDAIRRGLATVRCPARIEVLRMSPTVVVDTAHNLASIAALLRVLVAAEGFARRHLVFACSRDKDAEAMLEQLWPHFDNFILTRFANNPRALAPEELVEMTARIAARQASPAPTISTARDPQSAWHAARTASGPADLVCITGSFFLAAELRRYASQH